MDRNYQILSYSIGKGAFGEVYLGLDKINNKLVAIKTEQKHSNSVLSHENNIIRYVQSEDNNILKSKCFWEDLNKCYLVTDLLGPSIEALHKICSRSFSLKTTIMLTEQMLGLIKYYHLHDIVHRDIKPGNFLINYDLPHKQIYLIDFGLAKKYKVKNVHIPYIQGKGRVGSLRYMSKHVHAHIEPTCRDDMYSLGYCIIYIFTGILPWQGEQLAKFNKKELNEYIGKLKTDIPNNELTASCICNECRQLNKPCTFQKYMEMYFDLIDRLGFSDEVNYDYLIKELLECFNAHSFQRDYQWDWNKYYMISAVGI